MTDKQIPNERRQYEYKSVFTYTDNTTDDNDKIMENLHKQIIIDGVYVSGCEKHGETIAGITCGNGERIRLANEIITKHKLCKDNPNCVYKQLKLKEQECEELKDEIKHYKQIAQYHGNLSVKYTNKSAKYKQALTKIKEIAEKQVKRAPDGETFARPEIKQILQKISEVENDNK